MGESKSVEYIIEVKLLSAYQFTIDCYNYKALCVSPMVTPEEISIEDTQKKMMKESNYAIIKNINETQRKIAREEKRHKKAAKQTKQLTK